MERPAGRPKSRATGNGVKKGKKISSSYSDQRYEPLKTKTTTTGPENGRRSSRKHVSSAVPEDGDRADQSSAMIEKAELVVEEDDDAVSDSGWDVATTFGADTWAATWDTKPVRKIIVKDSAASTWEDEEEYDGNMRSLEIATSVLSWTPDILRNERFYDAEVNKLPRLPCTTSEQDYMNTYGIVVLAEMHSSLSTILEYPEKKADRPLACSKVMHAGKKKKFRGISTCCIITLGTLSSSFIRPSDFVYLSTTPKPWEVKADDEEDFCAPGIVQQIGKTDGKILVAIKEEYLERIKDAIEARNLLIVVVSSIASELRIYSALCTPDHSKMLMKHILAPGPVKGAETAMQSEAHDRIIADLVSRSKPLNPSQRHAVLTGMQSLLGPISYPILIQGPPGTGKTHTLSSMILAIMLAKSDQLVHVVAPSNAAMREIAVRLLRDAAHTRILHTSEILLFGTEQKIDLSDGIDAIYFNSRLERAKDVSKRLDDLKARVLSARQDNPEGRLSTWHTEFFSPLKDLAEEGIEVLTILGNDFNHKDVDGWKGIPLCVDLLTRWKRDLNAVIGNKPPNVGVVLEKLESMLDDISMTISNDPEVLEQAFVESTKVFFSTVNSAGGKILDMFVGRSRLIILDEATQTLEPEMSILLKDDIVGLVAIGDPQQLPGVVANRKLESKGYSISLFERLLNAGSPHLLLATQYRMHPDISQWPANTYYDGQLEDGRNTIMSGRTPSWQIHGEELFSPYSFIAIHGLEEKNLRTKSYCNQAEANVVLSFLQRLLTTLIRTDHEGEVEVGCITGYTAQVRLVVKNLSRLPGSIPIETASKTEKVRIVVTSRCSIVIDVASVDAFQGQERDIIIFATTRANNGRQLGFLKDARRLNVALTRARFACKIIGNAYTLMADPMWQKLIGDAQLRGNFFEFDDTTLNVDDRLISKDLAALSKTIASMQVGGPKIKVGPVVKRCIMRWKRRIDAIKYRTRHLQKVDKEMFRRLDQIPMRPLMRHAIFNQACGSMNIAFLMFGRAQQALRWATTRKGLLNKAVARADAGDPEEWLTAFCKSHRNLRQQLVSMRTQLSIASIKYEDADTIIYESQFMELAATEFDQKYGLVINCVYEAQGAL